MRGSQPEHRTTCTVAVERNRYGAMTLRSAEGRTYQVVGVDERSSSGSRAQADDSEGPRISRLLDQLSRNSRVSVTLTKAHGRGDSWRVTEIDAADRDSTICAGRQPPWTER